MLMWQKALMRGANLLPTADVTLQFAFATGNPYGAAIDGDGNLWVAGYNGQGMAKYDGFSNTELMRADSSGDYRGVAWNGSKIIASEFDDKLIRIFNSDGWQIGNPPINLGYGSFGLVAEGGRLCISNSNEIKIYAGLDVTGTPDVITDDQIFGGFAPMRGMTLHDGNLVICEEGSATRRIVILDGYSATVLRTLTMPYRPRAVVSYHGDLYSIDNDRNVYKHGKG